MERIEGGKKGRGKKEVDNKRRENKGEGEGGREKEKGEKKRRGGKGE